jgi:Zn-dependent metalloprotease
MKKNIIFLIFAIITLNTYASKHNHDDKNEVRYIKQSQQLNTQFQQQLRNQVLWQSYLSTNPDWFVIFNENNQLPHRAFGAPISLNSTSGLLPFLASNNFTLPNDLRENSITKNDKHINLSYSQYYNNLEVLNSKLYAKFSLANELISFGLDIFNDINISVVPILNEQSAIASATSNISASISDIIVNENLKILANPQYRKYEYNLVYVVKFKTRIDEGPAHYICYIDAHTGELLMRKNEVMYEAPPSVVNVSGEVYTTHPFNPSSTEVFPNLKAIDQTTNIFYYTDTAGDVNLPLSNGASIRYKLEGLYANVETNASTPDIFANLGTSNTIIFDNSNSTIQERTAYWAVNEVHAHLKSVFPTFTGLDFDMETNIDVAGSCNAFYSGSINFYAEGGGCNATAKIPDVVYHEYGHAINDYRYNSSSGMWNGALNEGFADVWALSLTETPVLGFGWDLVDPTVSVRRYDQNRKVYPQDLVGEVHADGEIIAGAFWDTYLNLGSMTQMLDLFKYTYDSGVDGANGDEGIIFVDILLEVLFADDNDADLTNGTPNDCAIVSAFALHGITMLSNAVISHNPISIASGNTAININATVGITYPWCISSANCFYRLNDATSWNNLAMSGTSSPTTTIPAQPNGTVIAYYISLTDILGNELGITPQAANLTPIHNANIPYFIMVGYELMQEEDFDFNFGFWQTGDVNDNATTGMWEIGTPIPSYADPSNFTGIVQTGTQHTSGGSQCAFTGNASSITAGIGENDVDDGHTTLFSPYYDLTEYANPAFSYYRWYTNSPASGANPGADWWQVLITDDGVNWHYVENNMSSDINWRKFAFRAQDYVNLTNIVQLKFIASDSTHLGQNLDGGSLIEAAIDDLYLYDAQSSTSINEVSTLKPKLIKITDVLGREVNPSTLVEKTTLLYIYDDGSVEKRIMIE